MLRKVFERINVNWIKHLWNTGTRTFESKNRITLKWMHLGRNATHEYLVSQSVSVLSSFKSRLMMPCLKKGDWKNCVITREKLDRKFVKFKTEKKFVHIFIIHQSSFEKDTKYYHWARNILSAIFSKGTNWKFIFPWRKIN